MASQLGFSLIEENKQENKKTIEKFSSRTLKKRKKPSKKLENFLNSISDDNDNMADFNPPPQAELTKQPDEVQENDLGKIADSDNDVSVQNYSELNSQQTNQQYYNNYIPYYTQNNTQSYGTQDELMTKLNYMIHLLEENKDEKTDNVVEELILYMFLGVFVIFTVDSFTRAGGKYKR